MWDFPFPVLWVGIWIVGAQDSHCLAQLQCAIASILPCMWEKATSPPTSDFKLVFPLPFPPHSSHAFELSHPNLLVLHASNPKTCCAISPPVIGVPVPECWYLSVVLLPERYYFVLHTGRSGPWCYQYKQGWRDRGLSGWKDFIIQSFVSWGQVLPSQFCFWKERMPGVLLFICLNIGVVVEPCWQKPESFLI